MSDDPEWLAWRRGGITATDVADAANGTYGGAYAVVARKLGLVTVDQTVEMRRGHWWQPRIADAVHALLGWHVVGEEAWCESVDDPIIRATVDGFLSELPEVPVGDGSHSDVLVGPVEVKTRAPDVRPNRDRWRDQMQWQMLAVDRPVALLAEATVIDAPDPEDSRCVGVRFEQVDADPARQQFLVDLAHRLWDDICEGRLPDPDQPDALDVVKQVHADADPDAGRVDLSDLDDDIARLAQIQTARKLVDQEAKQLEARIRHHVGDALGGDTARFKVSVSNPANVLTADAERALVDAHPDYARRVLDRDRFKADHPDLYDAARQPVGARRLTIRSKETSR